MGLGRIVQRYAAPIIIAGTITAASVFGACNGKDEPVISENTTTITSNETSTQTTTIEQTLEERIKERLMIEVPEIEYFTKDTQHMRVVDNAVLQIRDEIYNRDLDKQTEKINDVEYDAWYFVNKVVGSVLPGLKKVDLNNYSDMELKEILLPQASLSIDIKSILDGNRDVNYNLRGWGYGIKNVTPNEALGEKSPLGAFIEWVREEYDNKNSMGYSEAIRNATSQSPKGWPNSASAFQAVKEELLAKEEDAPLFVIGWSVYKVGEKQAPSVSTLVSRSMDEPLASFNVGANYPTGPSSHNESWVFFKGKAISSWMDQDKFFQDYQPSTWPNFKGDINEPNLRLYGPDGLYSPYTLKPIK